MARSVGRPPIRAPSPPSPAYVFRWTGTNSSTPARLGCDHRLTDTAWYGDVPNRIRSQGTTIRITLALDAKAEALISRPQSVG